MSNTHQFHAVLLQHRPEDNSIKTKTKDQKKVDVFESLVCFSLTSVIVKIINLDRSHSFSTYATFSGKLTFITPSPPPPRCLMFVSESNTIFIMKMPKNTRETLYLGFLYPFTIQKEQQRRYSTKPNALKLIRHPRKAQAPELYIYI